MLYIQQPNSLNTSTYVIFNNILNWEINIMQPKINYEKHKWAVYLQSLLFICHMTDAMNKLFMNEQNCLLQGHS